VCDLHFATTHDLSITDCVLSGWPTIQERSVTHHGQSFFYDESAFQTAKRVAIAGLTVGMLMWLGAFLTFGSEWFLMWQSRNWSGQDAGFRMLLVEGAILLLLLTRPG
jgi:hypothetical protein